VAKATILVVDDEKNILASLKTALSLEGFSVLLAGSGELALSRLAEDAVDLVLLDVKLPGVDGLEVLRRIRERWPLVPVVMMSGHGTIQVALEAIRMGALDFIEKPLASERIVVTINNALHLDNLQRENLELKTEWRERLKIVGSSKALKAALDKVKVTAPTQSRVLILGENGTGKELIALAIHEASPRASCPFIKVNCAAVPSELIESELFGHVKGAFTGAVATRKGKFELADGGTIFLDEIGDMKLEMQSKLLRVLQEGQFERVGDEKTITVDVRVIAATNRNLEGMVAEGRFRQDLYYRLAVIPIVVPPLRERTEDIIALVEHFSGIICRDNNRPPVTFEKGAIELLEAYYWPGNVRELRNIVERLVILSGDNLIGADAVGAALPSAVMTADRQFNFSGKPLKELVSDFEKAVIEQTMKRNEGHVSKSARQLGLERSHLYKKMRAFGIKVAR
jgi:DNA-binding NtrC family response regulator